MFLTFLNRKRRRTFAHALIKLRPGCIVNTDVGRDTSPQKSSLSREAADTTRFDHRHGGGSSS